jgi:recombinational DNA repair protein (RecF pathway)
MYTCQLCRFDLPLDDVALRRGEDGCICLACYSRETDSARPMPKALRRQLQAALAALDHVA